MSDGSYVPGAVAGEEWSGAPTPSGGNGGAAPRKKKREEEPSPEVGEKVYRDVPPIVGGKTAYQAIKEAEYGEEEEEEADTFVYGPAAGPTETPSILAVDTGAKKVDEARARVEAERAAGETVHTLSYHYKQIAMEKSAARAGAAKFSISQLTPTEKKVYEAARKRGLGTGEAMVEATVLPAGLSEVSPEEARLIQERERYYEGSPLGGAAEEATRAWREGRYVPRMEKVPTTADLAYMAALAKAPYSPSESPTITKARLEAQYWGAHDQADKLSRERTALVESYDLKWDEAGKLPDEARALYYSLIEKETAVRGEARLINSVIIHGAGDNVEHYLALKEFRDFVKVSKFNPDGTYEFSVDIVAARKAGLGEAQFGELGISGEKVAEVDKYLASVVALGEFSSYKVADGYDLTAAAAAGITASAAGEAGFKAADIKAAWGPVSGISVIPGEKVELGVGRELTIGPAGPLPELNVLGFALPAWMTPGHPGAFFGPVGPLAGLLYPTKEEYAARYAGFPEGVPQLGQAQWLGRPESKFIAGVSDFPVIVGPVVGTAYQWEYLTPLQRGIGIATAITQAALIGIPIFQAIKAGRVVTPETFVEIEGYKPYTLGMVRGSVGFQEAPATRAVFTGTSLEYPLRVGTFPTVPGLYSPTLTQELSLIRAIEPGGVVPTGRVGFLSKGLPYSLRSYFVAEGPRISGLFEPSYEIPIRPTGGWSPFRYIEPRVLTRPPTVLSGAGVAVRPTTATMTPEAAARQLRALGLEYPTTWAVGVTPPEITTWRVPPISAPSIYPGIYPGVYPSVGLGLGLAPSSYPYLGIVSAPSLVRTPQPGLAPAPGPALAPAPVLAPTPLLVITPPITPPITLDGQTPPSPPPSPVSLFLPGFGAPTMPGGRRRRKGMKRLLRGERWLMPGLVLYMPEPFKAEKRKIMLAPKRARKYGAREPILAGGIRI